METMKALVKARKEVVFWMQDVPVPSPGKNEVLIKILRTAICATDVHIYNRDEWAQQAPRPHVHRPRIRRYCGGSRQQCTGI